MQQMGRIATFFLFMAPWAGSELGAQTQFFDKTSHNFGYVARGSHVQTVFKLTNRLQQPLHIASVRPSCPICSITQIEKEHLAPGESMDLVAGMKTAGFSGSRSVSVTVTFDRPYYTSMRLTMQCYSRPDVVFSPGEIQLGTVKRGDGAEKKVKIEYAGKADWEITSVSCPHKAVQVSIKETHRNPAPRGNHHEIGYVLTAILSPEANPGSVRDRVILGVNDAYNKELEIPLQAAIQANVSITPDSLAFSGPDRKKRVFVRGVRPFKIVSISTQGGPFQIETPTDSKRIHFLDVRLAPDPKPGKVEQEFEIKTDFEGELPLKLVVTANLGVS